MKKHIQDCIDCQRVPGKARQISNDHQPITLWLCDDCFRVLEATPHNAAHHTHHQAQNKNRAKGVA